MAPGWATDPQHGRVERSLHTELIGESADAFKNWEAAVRLQVSLATKLRITPQYDPKTIARREPQLPPWETGEKL